MNDLTITPDQAAVPDEEVLNQLKNTAVSMSLWLKILGIVMIVGGALTALSIVGIIVAWLPIWLGVLLVQAGDRAQGMQYSANLNQLLLLLEKLKTYFVVSGVVTVVSIAFSILSFVMMISFMSHFSKDIQEFLTFYF